MPGTPHPVAQSAPGQTIALSPQAHRILNQWHRIYEEFVPTSRRRMQRGRYKWRLTCVPSMEAGPDQGIRLYGEVKVSVTTVLRSEEQWPPWSQHSIRVPGCRSQIYLLYPFYFQFQLLLKTKCWKISSLSGDQSKS